MADDVPFFVTEDVIEMLPVPHEGQDCEWRRMTPAECEARTDCTEGARLELPDGQLIELIANDYRGFGIPLWSVLTFSRAGGLENCSVDQVADVIACTPAIAGLVRNWEDEQTRA